MTQLNWQTWFIANDGRSLRNKASHLCSHHCALNNVEPSGIVHSTTLPSVVDNMVRRAWRESVALSHFY